MLSGSRLCDLTIFDLSRIRARRSYNAHHAALGLCVKQVQQQPSLYQRYVCQQSRRNPLGPAARRSSTSAAFALAARPLLSAHPPAPALATDKPRNSAHSLPHLLAASQLACRAGAIRSNRQLRIVALLVLRLIHAWPRRALAAQNLKHVSHAAAAALATRRRSERLTDAFTKLLLPGTRMRDTSACDISRNMLL